MTLTVEWIPASSEAELLVPAPKPAKLYIPEWYKQIEPLKTPKFSSEGQINNKNIKSCMPFLDALTSGYIQESWTDIYIEKNGDSINYYHPVGPQILEYRGTGSRFNFGDSFHPAEFVWKEQWLPKLPKGYSMLYTSPFNRFDLPFRSLDAVIDSDMYHHEYSGQYPFYIYNHFSGLIPAGTPLFQMIPIKRDRWESFPARFLENENKIKQNLIRKSLFNSYKKQFWQKKEYN
jgi:hypothetical protein